MAITLRNTKGAPLTHVEMDTNFNELDNRLTTVEGLGGGGATVINDLTDVDTTGAINGSVLKYDGANWTIAVDTTGISLSDLSVGAEATASGDGAISYDNTTGVFTYTPPDLSDYQNISTIDFAIDGHLNTSTATGGQILSWTGADYAWVADSDVSGIALTDLSVGAEDPASGDGAIAYDNTTGVFTYTPPDLSDYQNISTLDSAIDTHLNTSTATSGQILSWTGADYDWIAQSGGATYDQSLNTTDDVTFNSVTTGALTVNGAGTSTIQSGNNIVLDATNRVLVSDTPFRLASLTTTERNAISAPDNGDMIYNSTDNQIQYYENGVWNNTTHYADSDVDLHLNTSTATSGQILSWNGSDYAWVADSDVSGIALSDLSVGAEGVASGDGAIAYDNTTGVFTYTPPTASGIGAITLTDLSVGAEDPASGDGAIAYNNTTGVFTYTPPDLSSYITSYTETDPVVGAVNGIVKADGAGNISAAIAGTDYTLANQSLDTTSNVTFNQLQVDSSITENNHTLTGTSVALDPANGTIQTHTLTGTTTYTDSLADGQSITLLIPATANTITWPTMKWQGGVEIQPDATDDTLFLLFKIGTTLYGSSGGTFS